MKTNKSCLLITAMLTFLFFLPPTRTLAQDISTGDNNHSVESNTSTTSKSENQAKYSIPSIYKQKLDTFLKNSFPIIKIDSTSTWKFTADFVKKEIESDWGISKNNQMLFVWHSIYVLLTGKDLYDGRDGDSIRYEEFKTSIQKIKSCRQRYKEGILPFINKQSAEYDRQIAEYDRQIAANKQQSAEYDRQIAANKQQIAEIKERLKKGEEYLKELKERNKMTKDRIMHLDSIGIKNMAEFYIVYTSNSDVIDDGVFNIDRMKVLAKIFVDDCKKYRIDFKDILMKEVKTREGLDDMKARRKVDEMLKFYDVE